MYNQNFPYVITSLLLSFFELTLIIDARSEFLSSIYNNKIIPFFRITASCWEDNVYSASKTAIRNVTLFVDNNKKITIDRSVATQFTNLRFRYVVSP